MVAVIHTSKSLRSVLAYNENKVRQTHAKLICASGYAKDLDQLTAADKIGMLRKRTELNLRCKVNTLHISLNFHPDEKLPVEKLQQITESYMAKIGFGSQPYLVYQHHDSSHPHVHIVTTNIRVDGSRISLHNLGKMQSESARKEIEITFGLVRAEAKQQIDVQQNLNFKVKKVLYGDSNSKGSKQAITNVLTAILPNYRFTSLPELNAVLAQYHILADRGSKESRVYKNMGLVYRVLDQDGKTVGVPIPASSFKVPATLKYLNQRFQENTVARERFKVRIKNNIDSVFLRKAVKSFDVLTRELSKENIQLVSRQNERGLVYGLTYIDHKTKSVFNGSDIGKLYSANEINRRINSTVNLGTSVRKQQESTISVSSQSEAAIKEQYQPDYWKVFQGTRDVVVILLQQDMNVTLNPELTREINKRRKRKINQ